MYRYCLSWILMIPLFCGCTKNSKVPLSNSGLKQDCYKERNKEEDIANKEGVIEKIADQYFIVSIENRYLPCDIPNSFKIPGTKIIFSGALMAVHPQERWAGLPLHLSFIAFSNK